MKRLVYSLLVITSLAVTSAKADTFNYAYYFPDGNVVSGSFIGDQNGNFVENISDVSLFFNGLQASGPIFTAKYTGSDWAYGPIVSFDVSLNNFMFINSDLVAQVFDYDSYFTIANDSVFYDEAYGFSLPYNVFIYDNPTSQARWSLSAVSTPDASSSLSLLGLSLVVLAGLRRRLA